MPPLPESDGSEDETPNYTADIIPFLQQSQGPPSVLPMNVLSTQFVATKLSIFLEPAFFLHVKFGSNIGWNVRH